MSGFLTGLLRLFTAAFGEAVADIFRAWQADQDARDAGQLQAELDAATKTQEVQDAMAQADAAAGDAAGRLRDGTF